jgi:hypothetical protein
MFHHGAVNEDEYNSNEYTFTSDAEDEDFEAPIRKGKKSRVGSKGKGKAGGRGETSGKALAASKEEASRKRKRAGERGGAPGTEAELEGDLPASPALPVSCGDLTSRLLSALVEENVVFPAPNSGVGYLPTMGTGMGGGPSGGGGGGETDTEALPPGAPSTSLSASSSASSSTGGGGIADGDGNIYSIVSDNDIYDDKGKAKAKNKGTKIRIKLDQSSSSILGSSTSAGPSGPPKSDTWTDIPSIPLSQSPVPNYAPNNYLSLEERIKMELRNIGLLPDTEIDPRTREDDEVCAEMRVMFARLRQQVRLNNERRAHLHALALPRLKYYEDQMRQAAADKEIEKRYLRYLAKKKRAKKKST